MIWSRSAPTGSSVINSWSIRCVGKSPGLKQAKARLRTSLLDLGSLRNRRTVPSSNCWRYDGVAEIAFGLGEQIANRHRLSRARHAEQDRVLGRLVVSRVGERLNADEIVVRAVIDGFRGGKMSGEGAGHREHHPCSCPR